MAAIGLNGLYRFPLARRAEFPPGRLHPYAGVGLGAFIARFETRMTALDVATHFADTDVRVGAQALAGARFFLTADFTFTPISDVGTRGGLATIQIDKLQFGLTTHMLQVGIAYHW